MKTAARKYADMLSAQDVNYLASVYDMDSGFIGGMDDAEWCQFIGCEKEDLPYYLFDDELFDSIHRMAASEKQTQPNLFKMEDFLEREFKPKKSSPVFAKPKPKKKVVKHHFELVR